MMKQGTPFEFQPSGSVLEYFGAAIGARSQAARTYLERNLEEIKKCDDVEKLVLHGLYALRDTLSQDVELTFKTPVFQLLVKIKVLYRMTMKMCNNGWIN